MGAATAAVAVVWSTPGAADIHTVTREAVVAAVAVLNDAGCLAAPPPKAPELTVEDAARLLCRLSRTRLLDDPENDYQQLLDRSDRVEYAWANAVKAGIDPADAEHAHAARRLLEAHHGLR